MVLYSHRSISMSSTITNIITLLRILFTFLAILIPSLGSSLQMKNRITYSDKTTVTRPRSFNTGNPAIPMPGIRGFPSHNYSWFGFIGPDLLFQR
jgi:hypothetical protein